MKPKKSGEPLVFAVAEFGAFLSTRDLGAQARNQLEAQVRTAAPVTMLSIDFKGVEAMTNSFADELVGKFYLLMAAGDIEAGGVQLVGLNEETRDAVTVCLERRKRFAVDADEQMLLGDAAFLADTYDLVRRLDEFRAATLAEALGISLPNANNRLKRLVEAGALQRDRASGPEHGGKEFAYRVPNGTTSEFASSGGR
jgi:hypothetical protein